MSTILVVEDTQDNFDLIADVLDDAYDLVHARTGTEGLAQALSLKPDLILLDLSLPEIDGWEVARRLNNDARVTDIPVIAVTAHAMQGDRAKCLAAGCDGYLAKPIDVAALRGLVESYLADAPAK
jgi:two-component system cell cycle response regulator DivK